MLLIVTILHRVLTPVLLASLCWTVFALASGVHFSTTRAFLSSWIALSSALLTIATGIYGCLLDRLQVSSSPRSMIPGLLPSGAGVCFDAMTYVGLIVPIMWGVVIVTMAWPASAVPSRDSCWRWCIPGAGPAGQCWRLSPCRRWEGILCLSSLIWCIVILTDTVDVSRFTGKSRI